MDDVGDLDDVRRELAARWGISPTQSAAQDREAILELLALRVEYLLEHNLDRLMSALYILDVPEDQFGEALAPGHEVKPARRLAEAILDREIARVNTRRRYSQPAIDDDTSPRSAG